MRWSGRRRMGICAIAVLVEVIAAHAVRAEFFFGDLHAHSGLSDDATGTPEGFFVAARDIADLDFVALSDHDAFLTPNEWDILNATASSFDRPGEFVAFSAVEWTHHWHMNAVFERHDEEYCEAADCGFPPDFFTYYGPRVRAGAAAAHINHPADIYKVDWLQIDDTITTSVEVWNTAGAGDNERGFGNALWALRAGYQLGFVGVSDDHHTDRHPLLLGTGLTACDVAALAPADLIEALRARRCYATSGERIELSFTVDGAPMGAEIARPLGSSLPATVSVRATATPVVIELLQDGDVIATKRCGTPLCELVTQVRARQPNGFVYARVTQPDEERAWSSPVWLRGGCADGSQCLASRLARGGGPSEDDCIAEWLFPWPPFLGPYHRASDQIVCDDGDPRCDFGDAAGECRVRVGLCFGVEDPGASGCSPEVPDSYRVVAPADDTTDRESPDFQNRQALLAMFHTLRPSEGGVACSPLSELRVPIGLRTIATRAQAGDRTDDDELAIECRSAPVKSRRLARRPAAS